MKENNTVEAEIVEDSQIVLSEIKYPVSTTDLNALLEQYKDIPDIDPDADEDLVGKQYQFVLSGHKAFVKARTGIEKTRKRLKQPALDYGKKVDEIAKEFQAMINKNEDKLQVQRKKVEDNEARKQREAEEKEEARIDAIKTKIHNVKNLPLQHFNSSTDDITKALESLTVISEEEYEEFFDEAVQNQNYVISQLQTARDNKILVENAEKIQADKDAESKRIQDEKDEQMRLEREEFEKQQSEFKKQKDDFERQQREQQELLDEREAEREAEELLKKQDADKLEKERINNENFMSARKQTIEYFNKCVHYDALLEDIINGLVPNVKWVL